jgi:hypothetical protein
LRCQVRFGGSRTYYPYSRVNKEGVLILSGGVEWGLSGLGTWYMQGGWQMPIWFDKEGALALALSGQVGTCIM